MLLKTKISVETLINKFLLDDFPKFVVLQLASGSTNDSFIQGLNGLTVQSGHLLLDHRNNIVPEVGIFLKLVRQDELECEHDLLGCQVLFELLHNINEVRSILAGE